MEMSRKTITEASKLAVLNDKSSVLRLIAFLLIAPFFLLTLLHSLIAGPLMQKVDDSYEASSLDLKDVRTLLALEIPFFLSFSLFWLFGISSTIVSAALAYGSNKSLFSLKDFMLLWIKSTSKKIIHSWLYVLLFTFTFLSLFLASLTSVQAIFSSNTTEINWIIVTVAAFLYPYLASIFTLGLVISVLEDGILGIWAIEEARKLINDRKKQSYFLTLMLTLLSIPNYLLYYLTATDDDDRLRFVTKIPFIFVATTLFGLTNYVTFVVFTVFYLEIKRTCTTHDGDFRVELQPLGIGFCLIPSLAHHADTNTST